ncbi:MAG: hypothetical protein VKJ64_20810 [Leptolyngbyaceae bacterium]|nr:hypothetical protein [Leptolyngbyaceae bacterium]
MSYTTEQLIEILDHELRATWKGDRIVMSSGDRISNPVVARALGTEKLSKVFAYQDFRNQIHDYQRQHNVSGIIWRTCRFNSLTVQVPEVHGQLIPIETDKQTLINATTAILEFWYSSTNNMQFWLTGNDLKPITASDVERLVGEAEWVELDVGQSELYLSLCWGTPQECHYQWSWPGSWCERVIAANSTPTLTKV